MIIRNVRKLTVWDLQEYPVWEYTTEGPFMGDFKLTPVTDLPVSNLSNRIVATQVKFEEWNGPMGCLIQYRTE